jgi:broad specificity phosphatase PhoE
MRIWRQPSPPTPGRPPTRTMDDGDAPPIMSAQPPVVPDWTSVDFSATSGGFAVRGLETGGAVGCLHKAKVDPGSSQRKAVYVAVALLLLMVLLAAPGGNDSGEGTEVIGPASTIAAEGGHADQQHIYIVRHADKFSSYADCPDKAGRPCFNASLMGNNPPLTPCGRRQAEHAAKWVHGHAAAVGGIANIVSSPFTRCLQTALPLAQLQPAGTRASQLQVEYLLSEDRRQEGPHSPFNAAEDGVTVSQLEEINDRWAAHYGSPPIRTPETTPRFHRRVRQASATLRNRFPPNSGNLVVHTHATTSFSLAYGLCHGRRGDDSSESGNGAAGLDDGAALESFLDSIGPIGPAGVLHLVMGADGTCRGGDGGVVNNSAYESVDCRPAPSATGPWMCEYQACPAWYWEQSAVAAGQCEC